MPIKLAIQFKGIKTAHAVVRRQMKMVIIKGKILMKTTKKMHGNDQRQDGIVINVQK